jgi:hypothetical protein
VTFFFSIRILGDVEGFLRSDSEASRFGGVLRFNEVESAMVQRGGRRQGRKWFDLRDWRGGRCEVKKILKVQMIQRYVRRKNSGVF